MAIVGYGLYNERRYLFKYSPAQVSRNTYGHCPFPESVEVARYIREHSASSDRIAVLGSEPQIYFYANRISATPYIYMYGLMEEQPHAETMQREMINEIKAVKPLFVVIVDIPDSWLSSGISTHKILENSMDYFYDNYQMVGICDIYNDYSIYLWDKDVVDAKPHSKFYIRVLKRKTKLV
jgi:hypothetical protein